MSPPKAPLPIKGKKSSGTKDDAASYGGKPQALGSPSLESQVSESLSQMRRDPLSCLCPR